MATAFGPNVCFAYRLVSNWAAFTGFAADAPVAPTKRTMAVIAVTRITSLLRLSRCTRVSRIVLGLKNQRVGGRCPTWRREYLLGNSKTWLEFRAGNWTHEYSEGRLRRSLFSPLRISTSARSQQ